MITATSNGSTKDFSLEECLFKETFYNEIFQNFDAIECITASEEDLETCCRLLGRPLPNCKIYTFYGDNAKEICLNLRFASIDKES
jgi:hypothetical protein